MPVSDGASIDRVLRDAVAARRVPGVVAAVTDRRGIVYSAAFGVADLHEGRAMRTDTVFRIASMTKLVTSVATLMLCDDGRLDLDAPFKSHYRGFVQPEVLRAFDPATRRYATSPAARAVTVRDLLTHTSGFGYWFLNRELHALTGAEPEYYNPPFLMHEPGSRFQYGVGTDVLGQLFEAVGGSPLEEFFARRVFGPLGMCDTGFGLPAPARLAAVHAICADGFEQRPNESVAPAPRGGGGLYSTAADYLALLRMLLNGGEAPAGQLLRSATVRALTGNQIGELVAERQKSVAPERSGDFLFMDGSQKFGFGVLLETRAGPNGRAPGGYSWAGIFNTYFFVDPAAGLAAVLLTQLTPFAAPVCIDIYEQFREAVYREYGAARRD